MVLGLRVESARRSQEGWRGVVVWRRREQGGGVWNLPSLGNQGEGEWAARGFPYDGNKKWGCAWSLGACCVREGREAEGGRGQEQAQLRKVKGDRPLNDAGPKSALELFKKATRGVGNSARASPALCGGFCL